MAPETEKSGSRLINTWVQITLGVAIFVWGIYAFFYEKQYVPNHMPPSVVIASSLQKVGETGSLTAIQGTITLKNSSKTRVWILSSLYNAYGLHITPSERNEDEFAKFVQESLGKQDDYFPRHFDSSAEVVLASKLTSETQWLEPDEEWTEQFPLYVPRGKYDSIELDVVLSAAKDERLLGTKWHAGPTNEIPNVLPGEIWHQTCVKPSESEKDPAKCQLLETEKYIKHKKLEEKYSLISNTSRSFLPLAEPVAAKRGAIQ